MMACQEGMVLFLHNEFLQRLTYRDGILCLSYPVFQRAHECVSPPYSLLLNPGRWLVLAYSPVSTVTIRVPSRFSVILIRVYLCASADSVSSFFCLLCLSRIR